MKRILFISPQPFFQWRGSPIRVKFNVKALAKLGFTVDLLTLPIGDDLIIDGVNIIRVANPLRIQHISIGPSLSKLIFDFLLLIKGIQLIRKNDYLVIHAVEDAGIIGVLLSLLAKNQAIFEKHSDPFSYKQGVVKNLLLGVYAWIERITVKHVDAVICTGQGLVEQVNNMNTATKAFHIFDIPSSLTEPSANTIVSIKNRIAKKNKILITFVGSFAVYQGIDLLMATIPLVVQDCPEAHFIIVGGKDYEIKERAEILDTQKCGSAITFVGMVDPEVLPAYLIASDILLSPRISGVNTPLKILDYFKAGRAIVATDVVAHRLLLNDKFAVLAQPNPIDLAQAIIKLVKDPDKREAMGKQGRALYEQLYNFKNYTDMISRCYQYVLDRQKKESDPPYCFRNMSK